MPRDGPRTLLSLVLQGRSLSPSSFPDVKDKDRQGSAEKVTRPAWRCEWQLGGLVHGVLSKAMRILQLSP